MTAVETKKYVGIIVNYCSPYFVKCSTNRVASTNKHIRCFYLIKLFLAKTSKSVWQSCLLLDSFQLFWMRSVCYPLYRIRVNLIKDLTVWMQTIWWRHMFVCMTFFDVFPAFYKVVKSNTVIINVFCLKKVMHWGKCMHTSLTGNSALLNTCICVIRFITQFYSVTLLVDDPLMQMITILFCCCNN